ALERRSLHRLPNGVVTGHRCPERYAPDNATILLRFCEVVGAGLRGLADPAFGRCHLEWHQTQLTEEFVKRFTYLWPNAIGIVVISDQDSARLDQRPPRSQIGDD